VADVFISYSRKDKVFVQHLAAALEQRGRDAWIDWDDIKPAENFMDAIYAAIEEAQTFVFIISPDSVESVVCGRELGHALKHNKRLIPLVFKDAPADKVPPALNVLNWIHLSTAEELETGVTQLIAACDADLVWIRMHTRLLVRAQDWQTKQRNASLLLSGDDLRDAENLVSLSSGKQPSLTELQQGYVLVSRQQATRLQRTRLIAATVALITALALATLAFWQYRVANEGRRVATAQRLAAEANRVRDESPQLSLLLGVEAQQITRREGEPPVAEASSALMKTLGQFGGWPLRGHTTQIRAVQFSSDSAWLVSSSSDSIQLWKLADAATLATPIALFGQDELPVSLSPDGRWMATVAAGRVNLWDLRASEPQVKPARLAVGDAMWTRFSPDGHWLACEGSAAVHLYRTDAFPDGALATLIFPKGRTSPIAFARLGAELVIGGEDGELESWELAQKPPKKNSSARVANGIARLEPSEDGRWILVITEDGGTLLLDCAGPTKMLPVRLSTTLKPERAVFSPDGHWLAIAGRGEPTADLFDLREAGQRELHPILQSGHSDRISELVFTADSQKLVTGSDDGTARVWDLSGRSTCPTVLRGHAEGVFSIAGSPDSQLLATGGRDDTIRVWNLKASDPSAASTVLRGLESVWAGPNFGVDLVAFSPDGRWLVGRGYEDTLRLWTVQSGRFATALPLKAAWDDSNALKQITRVAWSVSRLEGSTAWVKTAAMKDAKAAPPWKPSGREQVSPSGKWQLTRQGDHAELRETARPGLVARLPINTYATVRISKDERWLAANGSGKGVQLWDLTSPEREPHALEGHIAPVNNFEFSPDGKRLATLSSDALMVWDVDEKGEPIRLDSDLHRKTSDLAFSEDSRWLGVETTEGPHVWPLDSAALFGLAQRAVARNLTRAEWNQYFGSKSYRTTFDFPDAGRR
jgi:WD40 repeat protein